MENHLARFVDDESGTTAIEYALIGTLISVVIIAALSSMGVSLNTMFDSVATGLE